MAFRLLIECSREIDRLEIDFSDGTSIVRHSDENSNETINQQNKEKCISEKLQKIPKNQVDFLRTDEEQETISQEIIEKPNTDRNDRTISVASELQNLSI